MNSNDLITSGLFNSTLRMSSVEIASLMEKNHKDVMRDIRELIDQEAIDRRISAPISYLDSMNREQPMYELDFESTLVLVTGYDPKRRAMVIKRWAQLERGEVLPAGNLHEVLLSVPVINNLISTVSDLMAERGKIDARIHQLETGRVRPRQQRISPTSVVPFLAATYVQDGNAATEKELIYSLYRDFCQQTASLVEPRDFFFKILYQQGLQLRPGKLSVRGRTTKVVRGFGVKGKGDRQLQLFPAGVLGGERA